MTRDILTLTEESRRLCMRVLDELDQRVVRHPGLVDRRQARRWPCRLHVSLRWQDILLEERGVEGVVRNLSVSGMSLLTRRMFYPGQQLKVSFRLPGQREGRELLVHVSFCRYLSVMLYEIGLDFLSNVEEHYEGESRLVLS